MIHLSNQVLYYYVYLLCLRWNTTLHPMSYDSINGTTRYSDILVYQLLPCAVMRFRIVRVNESPDLGWLVAVSQYYLSTCYLASYHSLCIDILDNSGSVWSPILDNPEACDLRKKHLFFLTGNKCHKQKSKTSIARKDRQQKSKIIQRQMS